MCVQSRIMFGSEFSAAYKALAHNDRGLPHESRINYEVRQKNRSQYEMAAHVVRPRGAPV